MNDSAQSDTPEEAEERRKSRRLTVMVDLVTSTLSQDRRMSLQEARLLVERTESAVLRLFPGSQKTFHLLLRPRFDRIMRERWGRGLDEVHH